VVISVVGPRRIDGSGKFKKNRRRAPRRQTASGGESVWHQLGFQHLVRWQALESLARLQITIESILVQDSEPVGADLDGGRVLLSLRAGAYFNFNPMASEIWQMLAEPRRVGDILSVLRDDHDVDAETVARDVTPFLQTLVDHRLVRMIDSRKVR
jgi:Coenzyme PQQ synthesis protein D (PqqD)